MAKQFKDFNKETKDLLTKNFPAPGSWKVETKDKAADRSLTVNAVADWGKKAGLAVDIDYNMKEFNVKTKTNVSAAGNVKPKVTYEPCKGHKVETTLMSLSADADFEVVYEGELAGAQVYDKITKKAADVQLSYPVGPLVVGAGVVYGFSKGAVNWSAGARYSDKMFTASLVTKDAKTFTTGVYAPLKMSCCTAKLAVQVDCGHGKFAATAGAEAPIKCVSCCDLTARFKITNEMACAFSVISKLANNWTAVLSVECSDVSKFGVQLTRE